MNIPKEAYCSIPGVDNNHLCTVDSRGYGSCGYFAVLPDGSLCPYMCEVLKWKYLVPLWVTGTAEANRSDEEI